MHFDLSATFVYGRIKGFPRKGISERLVNVGCRLVRDARRASTIVVAHSQVEACVTPDGRLKLPFEHSATARLASEGRFRQSVEGKPGRTGGPYTEADLARLTGLHIETCRALTLFDALGSRDGSFGYQDVAGAKQAAALVHCGISLPAIIRASGNLASYGLQLSQARLTHSPWGEVVQQLSGRVADLDGQFCLVMDETAESAANCVEAALRREAEGDHAGAEAFYRRAERIDRRDPVIPFNLGNILADQGHVAEAIIAFRRAQALDAGFVEAGFNLAELLDSTGKDKSAIDAYQATLAAHPNYAQAIYNCARLLTRTGRFDDALPLWERFIAVAGDDPDVSHARRGALLCRLELADGER